MKITTDDIGLLSAYLDDQVNSEERDWIQSRLSSDENLRVVFEKIKRTRLILRGLPKWRVPRNFTLSEQQVKAFIRIPVFAKVFRFSSALASILLLVLFALDFSSNYRPSAASQVVPPAEVVVQAMPVEKSANLPPIIVWGPPASQGYGVGDGGRGAVQSNGSIPGYTIPQPDEGIVSKQAEKLTSEGLPESLQAPAAPDLKLEVTPTLPVEKMEAAPSSSISPLLGIRPPAERGTILGTSAQPGLLSSKPGVNLLRIAEFILVGLAIISALIGFGWVGLKKARFK